MLETFRILKSLVEARFLKPKTKTALAAHQKRKLAQTYRHFRIESEPQVSTKKEFVDSFQKNNVLGLSLQEARAKAERGESVGSIHFGLSTGTSGSRGVFMTSPLERARWAGTVIGRCVPTLSKPQKIAFFLRSDNELYHAANRKRVQLKHFDLQDSLDIADLNEYAPDIIMAPSYVLARLALSPDLKVMPSLVISSADVLDPWDEAAIRKRFSRLHQIYQATEGFLAASCALDKLHLNEDFLLFERRHLDEKRFVPIVTDFNRRSQRVIRLEVSDVLRVGEPCACGSPFLTLESVEGRLDEIFQTPRRLFRSELAASVAHLPLAGSDFRFTQTSANDFILKVSDERLGIELISALRAKLIESGISNPSITVETGFKPKLFEKRRRFVCELASSES